MHAAGFDDHDVAGLPIDAAAVMNVIAAPFDDEEHGAVQMAVLLAEGTGTIGFDMRLDGLANRCRAGRDAGFAVMLRPALPGLVAKRKHARLIEQVFGQLAISAFERADKGALLRPALPYGGLLAVMARAHRIGIGRKRLGIVV